MTGSASWPPCQGELSVFPIYIMYIIKVAKQAIISFLHKLQQQNILSLFLYCLKFLSLLNKVSKIILPIYQIIKELTKSLQIIKSMYSSEDRGNIRKHFAHTFEMIEFGDLDLKIQIVEGIILLGNTKAGKTTSAHYLTRQLLQSQDTDTGMIYKVRDTRYGTAAIGNIPSQSETQIPNCFDAGFIRNGLKLLDAPGYGDSEGCRRIISNGYFHYKLFSKISKMKFLITIEFNGIQGVGTGMKDTFIQFISGFEDLNRIKDDVFEAVGLLITKVPNGRNIEQIKKIIQSLSNTRFNKYSRLIKDLLKKILDKNRIFMIQMPRVEGQVSDINNNYLSFIEKSLEFWQRKTNQKGEPIIRNINTSIAHKLTDPSCQETLEQLSIFGEYFKEIILKKIETLGQIMEVLLKDAFGEQQSCNYMKVIERYVKEKILPREQNQEYKNYEEKRARVRKQLFDIRFIEVNSTMSASQDYPFWLKKIKVIEKLYEEVKKILNNQKFYTPEMNQIRLETIITTLKNLSWLAAQQNRQIVLKFCYQIYHIVDVSNNFNKIMSKGSVEFQKIANGPLSFILIDYPMNFKDAYHNIFENSVFLLTMDYLSRIKIENFTFLENSKQVQNVNSFFREFANKLKSLVKYDQYCELGEKSDEEVTKTIFSISVKRLDFRLKYETKKAEQLDRSLLNYEEELTQIISNLVIIFEEIEELFHAKRLDGIDDPLLFIMRISALNSLGQTILYKKDNENIALAIFDFLRDFHKICQIFDRKESDYMRDQQKQYKYYVSYMKMAERYGRRELALQKAQKAYNLALKLSKYENIQEITECMKSLTKVSKYEKTSTWIQEDLKRCAFPVQTLQKIHGIFYNSPLRHKKQREPMTPGQ